jgi:hypothetical protein
VGKVEYFGKIYRPLHCISSHFRSHSPNSLQ